MNKSSLYLPGLCLLLSACAGQPPATDSSIAAPAAWQYAERDAAQAINGRWWTQFGSPQLDRLIDQARRDSFDVAAAMARVRQAQASAVIAGAPLLPEVNFNLTASRERLLRGSGNSDLNATEISNVADRYAQTLAARQRQQIAELNLANARNVLDLVQTRYNAGSATALELAQQKSLVASQQRQLPLIQQLAEESQITLAALLGQPVQAVDLGSETFHTLSWPSIGPGVPSQLLSRRPDLAQAEAQLAAASADVTVARAAMLPTVTLGATLGSGAYKANEILRSPFYTLTSGLVAPIFNNGRLSAERDKARARQDELLQTYRGAIINGFADVEKALSSITRLDQQRQWQTEELQQAQTAFGIAESRYQAGAEDLLTVLETQRTLYAAQDLNVQLRLSRLQASIALYKALGGGWDADIR